MPTARVIVLKTIQNAGSYFGFDFGNVYGLEVLDSEGSVLKTFTFDGFTRTEVQDFYEDESSNLLGYVEEGILVGATSPAYYFSESLINGPYAGLAGWEHEYYGRNGTVVFPADDSDVALLGTADRVRVLGDSSLDLDRLELWIGYEDETRSAVIGAEDYATSVTLSDSLEIALTAVPSTLEPISPDFLWGLDQNALNQRRLFFAQGEVINDEDWTRQIRVGDEDGVAEVDEALLERMHIPFPRGQTMDWESVKQVSYIRPKCRVAPPDFYIDLWLGLQDELDSPIKWVGPKRWRPGKNKVFFDKSARFISLRARLPANNAFRLTGYDIEYKLVSKR